MRKLSRKIAIQKTLEMWKWLAKTGKDKDDYFAGNRMVQPTSQCYLCEYAEQQDLKHGRGNVECPPCPYFQLYGRCISSGYGTEYTPYAQWVRASTTFVGIVDVTDVKRWAKEIVEQLETLA